MSKPQDAVTRRSLLLGGAALAGLSAAAGLAFQPFEALAQAAAPEGEPFSADTVRKLAEELSQRDFARPSVEAGEPFNALTADQYRDIRFRTDQAIWRSDRVGAELHLLPRGWIYETPVAIRIVEDNVARKLVADGRLFAFGPLIDTASDAAPYAFSGFRVHAPLNRGDVMEEFAVFQGASYFRAVARGQTYGLSARGLAVNTAQPGGEEFPIFRAFWIERPATANADVVIHGLLDSPSVAGAYRFSLKPGQSTVMDISAVLYPRKPLKHVGLAPLTSMFLRGAASRRVNSDYRPSVHNSEGLSILNGQGERIWRPLTNPKMLQTSAFLDRNPIGFGLMQRDRSFQSYDDISARYERRPSLWIEPLEGWGDGFVELIEIPSEDEIHDNIVAYWTPSTPLEPGTPLALRYRLHWGVESPVARAAAYVVRTSVSATKKDGTHLFVVDFAGAAVRDGGDMPVADVSANAGAIAATLVRRHPDIGGVRVSFELNTGGAEMVELRLILKQSEQTISETWLYRWTV